MLSRVCMSDYNLQMILHKKIFNPFVVVSCHIKSLANKVSLCVNETFILK